MQLDLFVAAPTATAKPTPTSVPAFEESLEYDDPGGGGVVASYSLRTQNPHWEWFRSGLWAAVERYCGLKPHRWKASVSLELPDFERTQWSAHEIHVAQEDAAAAAAMMVDVARGLLEASVRGEVVETPGHRRVRAAEAHADANERFKTAQDRVDAEKSLLDSIDEDDPARYYQWRKYCQAKETAADIRRSVMDEFYLVHSWREFAFVPCTAVQRG